jgi:hypothetical protein
MFNTSLSTLSIFPNAIISSDLSKPIGLALAVTPNNIDITSAALTIPIFLSSFCSDAWFG